MTRVTERIDAFSREAAAEIVKLAGAVMRWLGLDAGRSVNASVGSRSEVDVDP